MGTQRKKRWRKEGRERGATQYKKVSYTLQEGEVHTTATHYRKGRYSKGSHGKENGP